MATQSIAVATMVVAELQDLYLAESALEMMYSHMRFAPDGGRTAGVLMNRLTKLGARADRLERLLDAMDNNEEWSAPMAAC